MIGESHLFAEDLVLVVGNLQAKPANIIMYKLLVEEHYFNSCVGVRSECSQWSKYPETEGVKWFV